jgi:hypothetical protein
MTYHVTQTAERARLLDLAERIEGQALAAWLGSKVNPYPCTDPRHEPAQCEIERQRMIRAARQRKANV